MKVFGRIAAILGTALFALVVVLVLNGVGLWDRASGAATPAIPSPTNPTQFETGQIITPTSTIPAQVVVTPTNMLTVVPARATSTPVPILPTATPTVLPPTLTASTQAPIVLPPYFSRINRTGYVYMWQTDHMWHGEVVIGPGKVYFALYYGGTLVTSDIGLAPLEGAAYDRYARISDIISPSVLPDGTFVPGSFILTVTPDAPGSWFSPVQLQYSNTVAGWETRPSGYVGLMNMAIPGKVG